MKKCKTALIVLASLLLLISLMLMIISIKKELLIEMVLGFILGVIYFVIAFYCFYFVNSKRKRKVILKCLNEEEKKLVNEATALVKSVDESIEISEFNVYRVDSIKNGKFVFDEENNTLNILIPFKKYLKYGEDVCFLAIVHEILHSQNLKNNEMIFEKNFLEGLNQLLTVWLIENCETKHKIPEKVVAFRMKLKNNIFVIEAGYTIYSKEVNMVSEIVARAGVDMKEVFLNYVDLNLEYFRSFVPSEYFIK